jgi:hypothetical protein
MSLLWQFEFEVAPTFSGNVRTHASLFAHYNWRNVTPKHVAAIVKRK